jgi:hypothetical protein
VIVAFDDLDGEWFHVNFPTLFMAFCFFI